MRTKKIFLRNGQTLTEVALIIGIVGLALIGMQVYVKRGLQGKAKDLTDKIIGPGQSAYQQDTSGLAIYKSTSELSTESTATLKELEGGAKSLSGTETTIDDYTSTTKNN